MSLSLRVWTEVTIHAHLPSSPNKNQSRKIPWKVQGVYSKSAGNSWFITLKVSTIQPFSRYTRWDFPAFLDEYHPLTWLKFFGQQKRIQHFPLKISLEPQHIRENHLQTTQAIFSWKPSWQESWNPDVADLLDPCYPLAETGAYKREGVTLPKTDIAIRIGGWETTFHLGRPTIRCYVSSGEGRCIPCKSSHLHFFRQSALRRCVAIQTRDIKQGLESEGDHPKNQSICGESFVPNLNWVVLTSWWGTYRQECGTIFH